MKPYKLASHAIWESENKETILKLDWNESTIEPPERVKNALMNSMVNNLIRYYPDVSNKDLIIKISNYVGVPKEYIQYFCSSDSAHESIIRTLINENDKILMLAPTYDNFRTTGEAQGATICYSIFEDNYYWSLKKFESDLNKFQPQMAYLCNPNNPTGTLIPKGDIHYLVEKYKGIYFIIDEAYYEFAKLTCADFVNSFNNIIITRTFSKAFSLAGMRMGYIIASQDLLGAINKVRNAKNIPQLSQIAALNALDEVEYMDNYVKEVNQAKRFFYDKLKNINIGQKNIVYGEGNFLVIEFKSMNDKKAFIERLKSNLIFVRDLSHMKEVELCVRITIGTEKQMLYVIRILEQMYEVKKDSII